MVTPAVETVTAGLEPLALIVRSEFEEPGIRFFTPAHFSQQVAFMKRPRGHKIAPHIHNLISRQVLYTQEVLFVRRGKVRVELFSSDKKRVATKILNAGDLILLCGGGHSLEMLEESVIIEVKQGPYAGEDDKTSFEEGDPRP